MEDIIAVTNRLLIRRLRDDDKENLFTVSKESPLYANLPKSESLVEMYKASCWQETTANGYFNALVFLKDSGELVGKVCMQGIDKPEPEFGIDIMSKYRNLGYGPEATIAFCNWYSDTYGITSVRIRIVRENAHSIHMFEKLGAVYQTSTSFFSEDLLERVKDCLSEETMVKFSQDAVRLYTLAVPTS